MIVSLKNGPCKFSVRAHPRNTQGKIVSLSAFSYNIVNVLKVAIG